jgi:arylsulfatase A-like enzyme/lysophospholipase L1-like esterase
MHIKTLSAALVFFSSVALAAERPNILFIFSDDHAEAAISAYGSHLAKAAPTPNLDRIAREGAIFHNSFCANSICGPSRACILTGLHSHSNGFLDNNNSRFDGSQTTFPQIIKKTGYQTAIVGKWHLVSNPTGFDYWEILPFMLMCQHKAPHRNWAPAPRHLTLFDNIQMPEPPGLFDDYGGNRSKTLKEHAMGIADHMYWGHDMKFHGKESLFPEYFLSGIANAQYGRMTERQKQKWDNAYTPKNNKLIADIKSGKLKGRDVTKWKYQRYIKDYLRTIRAVDENVGRMLKYLDDTGLAKNTIVIYSSDQGFYLGEHGWYDKRWMFEESLAMPFLIRWPGVIAPNTESQTLIQNIDYGPTFLDIAGADIPRHMHGRSLVPAFKDPSRSPKNWRDSIYYAYYGERTHRVARHDGVRTDRHKLIFFPDTSEWNLFDLQQDPHEMRSVHDEEKYASTMIEMKGLYRQQRSHFGVSDATIPRARLQEAWWKKRHQEKVKAARKGNCDLLLIGDSITHGWESAGRETFSKYYAGRNTLNLGFSGDRTQHVLWRLLNGELPPQVKPRVAVMMIGTNNTGHVMQKADETAAGIKAIIALLRDRRPEMKILLVGIFPRGSNADDPKRKLNDEVNRLVAELADNQHIHFMDISGEFLTGDGTLPKDTMPDGLHPNAKGYQVWAAAVEKKIAGLGSWQSISASP